MTPWGSLPEAIARGDLPAEIQRLRAASGRMLVALDDDPTGSQSVHGVDVVTVHDPGEYRAALAGRTPTGFVLTNTRGMLEPDARAVNAEVAAELFRIAAERGAPLDLVSRSDSTLRGHFLAEIEVLDAARHAATGRAHDAVLVVPAYLEAGRVTVHDVHWARVGDTWLPVGETEFARDATFGYTSSNLRDYVVEMGHGAVAPARITAVALDDIRTGGPDRVAELLDAAPPGGFVVVNALDHADLETVALAALTVQSAGKSFLYRTGPSFVRALAGQRRRPPLAASDIWPGGHPGGHGLIVVGSHVGRTSRQLAALRERVPLQEFEVDVAALLAQDAAGRRAYAAAVGAAAASALRDAHVLVLTSRALRTGDGRDASLGIARDVSAAVSAVARGALDGDPAWVLAKGGITSHDVAVDGLGIRRAEVSGQLFPGMVSVLRPRSVDPRALGRPYVVFAGNVGDDSALADVVQRMAGTSNGG